MSTTGKTTFAKVKMTYPEVRKKGSKVVAAKAVYTYVLIRPGEKITDKEIKRRALEKHLETRPELRNETPDVEIVDKNYNPAYVPNFYHQKERA